MPWGREGWVSMQTLPLQFALSAQSQLHVPPPLQKISKKQYLTKAENAVPGQHSSAGEAGVSHPSPKSPQQRSVTEPSEQSAKITVIRK